jgi:hypothetical protein
VGSKVVWLRLLLLQTRAPGTLTVAWTFAVELQLDAGSITAQLLLYFEAIAYFQSNVRLDKVAGSDLHLTAG